MNAKKSIGGLLAFRHADKPPFGSRKDEGLFSRAGILTVAVILIILIIGGIVCFHFFGPRPQV